MRERLRETPLVRMALADMWPHLPPERLLGTLLGSRLRLELACGDGLFAEREISAIHRPGGVRNASEDAWTAEDIVLPDELRHLVHGSGTGTYRHIVVDEAQDLTPMQARTLARRCPSGSMTILGDPAQATGPHQYEEWGTLARLLTGDQDWELAEGTRRRGPAHGDRPGPPAHRSRRAVTPSPRPGGPPRPAVSGWCRGRAAGSGRTGRCMRIPR